MSLHACAAQRTTEETGSLPRCKFQGPNQAARLGNQHSYLPRHLTTSSPPFILTYMFIFVSVFGFVLLGIKARIIDLHL